MPNWIVGVCLLGCGLYDMKKKKIPLGLTLGLCMVSLVYGAVDGGVMQTLTGILPGAVLLVVSIVAPGQIGKGDGLIAIAYGAVLGWQRTCCWLLFAFFFTAVTGVIIGIKQKNKRISLPFIPFLAMVHVGMYL